MGGATQYVDPYASPGDAWFDGYAVATLLWARIGRIGAFGRGGGRSLCADISHGKGQHLPTIFGVVSQQAPTILFLRKLG